MIRSFELDAPSLDLFAQLRRLGPQERDQFVRRFEGGQVVPANARIAYRDDEPVAAYSLIHTGEGALVHLSLRRPLDDEERHALLADLRAHAFRLGPARVLVNRSRSLHPLGGPGEGWELASHAVLHATPLPPSPSVPAIPVDFVAFGPEYLDTAELDAFLEHSDGEFTGAGLREYHEDADRFIGLMHREEGRPVAIGVTHESRPGVAGIQILGVARDRRGLGLGTALHAALMERAAAFAPLYVGATDAANAPMRRLLEKNGCVLSDEQWVYRTR